MKGILHKTDKGWVIVYKKHADRYCSELPVHPDDIKLLEGNSSGFRSGVNEVEFEIVKEYVEPDDSIHCNRGDDVEFAHLILPSKAPESSWEDIRIEFVKTYPVIPIGDTSELVWLFLRNRYHPPLKQ